MKSNDSFVHNLRSDFHMTQRTLAPVRFSDGLTGVGGDVSNVNLPAESLLGFGSELGAKDSQSNVDPSVREVLDRMRAHVLSGKGAYTPKGFEEAFRARTTEGERYFLPRAIPVYESRAGIVGATVVLQDVTRLRRFSELKDDLAATV